MMDDGKTLSISDMDGIPEAVLTLISQYDGLPFKATAKTVCWNDSEFPVGIGCFPTAGARYLRQWVSGSFVGQIPFMIQYRTAPTNNKSRIDSQKMLECLTKWLEGTEASLKDKNVTINKLERTSPVIKMGAYEDGSEVYQCTMIIEYTNIRR